MVDELLIIHVALEYPFMREAQQNYDKNLYQLIMNFSVYQSQLLETIYFISKLLYFSITIFSKAVHLYQYIAYLKLFEYLLLFC